ncbi:type II secretion system F family protein [Psychromonas sp. SP041]|uniref:type II secretion system F family protein n=1 Tax=Psychromonas sp. SP041 TaxID=1365007 RepID=UPI000470F920|nr:type II secretion system F family protein [Psychromonas sp. SP041]
MKTFKVITESKGRMEKRTIEALTEIDARREAKTYGRVVKISKSRNFFFTPPLEIQHRQVIFHRLAAMLGSKVGTGRALGLMEEHFGSPIGTTCRKLRKQVDAGYGLDVAMQNLGGKYFPPNVVALIQAGFKAGNSAEALSNAADFEREMSEVRKGSMLDIYVSIGTFFIAFAATFGTTRYAGPMMAESELMKMNSTIEPDPLYGFIATFSEITMSFTALVFISLLFLGTVGRFFNPSIADSLIVKVPFYKDLILAKNNYITMYSLSLLIGSGVPVKQALELSSEGAPKGKMKDDLLGALKNTEKGLPWSNAMSSLHATDRAALGQSLSREGVVHVLKTLSVQYRALYSSRLGTLGPALKSISALFMVLAGSVLFGLTIMPILQMAAQGF